MKNVPYSRLKSRECGAHIFNGRINRSHKQDSKNLHKYRGQKVSKGRISTRKKRYAFQAGDVVEYQGQIYRVTGTQYYREYLAIKGKKAIKAKDAKIVKRAGGWIPAAQDKEGGEGHSSQSES